MESERKFALYSLGKDFLRLLPALTSLRLLFRTSIDKDCWLSIQATRPNPRELVSGPFNRRSNITCHWYNFLLPLSLSLCRTSRWYDWNQVNAWPVYSKISSMYKWRSFCLCFWRPTTMPVVDTKERYQNDPSYGANLKHPHVEVSAIDTAAAVVSGDEGELDHEEAMRIRRKIDRHILPLMCSKSAIYILKVRIWTSALYSPLLDPVYG